MTSPVAALVEALERLERMAKDPMKSWDSGRCVQAELVEELASETLDAYRAHPPLRDMPGLSQLLMERTGLGNTMCSNILDAIEAALFGECK